mgnify:CR=1 FL=1
MIEDDDSRGRRQHPDRRKLRHRGMIYLTACAASLQRLPSEQCRGWRCESDELISAIRENQYADGGRHRECEHGEPHTHVATTAATQQQPQRVLREIS